MFSRRVVVTGLGAITPIGLDIASLRLALQAGRSGVRTIRGFDPSALPVRIAGEVLDFDARNYIDRKDRKSLKIMARTVQFAVAAARLALDDSGILTSGMDPLRLGVILGSSTVPGELADLGIGAKHSLDPATGQIDLRVWGSTGMQDMQPMWMLMHVPNMAACHISILHNAQGPNNTLTQNDVAGLAAMGEAIRTIQRGVTDAMLAGGADTRAVLIGLIRYCLFAQLSKRNDDPASACRPFDRDRDGEVVAEGSGVLVLEERDHALKRNARIHGEVVGFASGYDVGKKGFVLARIIRSVLNQGGITPADLDHVNAHAPGTTEEDAWEARALHEVFGTSPVPVVALKGYLGNMGAAGGAVELIASMTSMAEGVRPGTLNHDNTGKDCPIHVSRQTQPVTGRHLLKISCTELGHCAAILIRREE